MVDDAAVEVVPGSTGVVTDGDEDREVRIERVDEGERVSFEWWPAGQPDQSSSVELVIVPARPRVRARDRRDVPRRRHAVRGSGDDRLAGTCSRPPGIAADRPRAGGRAAVRRGMDHGSRRPLDDLFDALADPTRRRLLERLVHDGPHTATQLAAGSAVSRQAIVKHLQALMAVDLVAAERSGGRSATGRRPNHWPRSSTGCVGQRLVGSARRTSAPASYVTGRCSARNAIVFAHADRAAASSWNIGASSSKACPAISTLRARWARPSIAAATARRPRRGSTGRGCRSGTASGR